MSPGGFMYPKNKNLNNLIPLANITRYMHIFLVLVVVIHNRWQSVGMCACLLNGLVYNKQIPLT